MKKCEWNWNQDKERLNNKIGKKDIRITPETRTSQIKRCIIKKNGKDAK
jgi:propanediol dehydratase small subunit